MICIQLNGGLGNQMFQYAIGRSISVKNKSELILDTSILDKNSNFKVEIVRDFELGIFEVNAKKASSLELKRCKPLLYKLFNILFLKFGFRGIAVSKYYVEQKFSYDSKALKVSKNCFLSGYWQSPLYFQSIESVIREDFKFPRLQGDNNIDIAEKIKITNAVSIHIRRGDLLNSKFHGVHGTCSLDYYQRAISYVSKKITEPVFFIFSDDIEWVKENFNFDSESHYISGNRGANSYIDMQLMSICKHNIIANSSFSWWGAWLNLNLNKIVITPQNWFSDVKLNAQTTDLIPETWVQL